MPDAPTDSGPLHLGLGLARAFEAGDPYAFRFGAQQYTLTASDGDVTNAEFVWDDQLLADLTALRRPGVDAATMQRLGERLRKFLTALGWQAQEAAIAKATLAGRPVVITIRSAAAELYALPWELATLKSTGQQLGGLADVLLRYEWPGTRTALPAAPRARGRVLMAWSAAGGSVPAPDHIEGLRQACSNASLPFDTEADVLSSTSLLRLSAALETAQHQGRPIGVLHLLCHGSSAGSTFGLALDGDEPGQSAQVIDARRLEQVLQPFKAQLRLVVLMACDGGNPGALGNQLGSVAQCLHRAGFAAVVASRYPLSISGSTRFCKEFYGSLIGGTAPLESAIRRARMRLVASAGNLDWLSLQLYARSLDSEEHPFGALPAMGADTGAGAHVRCS